MEMGDGWGVDEGEKIRGTRRGHKFLRLLAQAMVARARTSFFPISGHATCDPPCAIPSRHAGGLGALPGMFQSMSRATVRFEIPQNGYGSTDSREFVS